MKSIEMINPPKTTRSLDVIQIATAATALGLGSAAGSLQSLRGDGSGFHFVITWASYVAFAVGALAGIAYWKIAANPAVNTPGGIKRVKIARVLLALLGVGMFLYPLRFVPRENLPEIATGLGLASLFLGTIVVMLFQAKRLFEGDTTQSPM